MNNSTAFKLAQLPANVLRVGVDPHKRQHAAVICTEHAQILSKFKVTNDRPGFEELRRRCEQFRAQAGASGVIFAIEAGAHYWRNLGYFLVAQGDTFRLVNPLTLKRQRDGEDLTRRKTDYRDAQMAAELLGRGQYTWTQLPQGKYAELRQAHETYQQLVVETARLKNQLHTALDELFPEFTQVFKALDGVTALTLLRTCPNPAQIAGWTEDEFLQRLRAAHGGQRLMRANAAALQRQAANSVGIRACAEALSLEVQLLAERLSGMEQQRQQAETYLTALFYQCAECASLLSIRGLGVVNAAGLLAHLGEVRHFSGGKQFAKLAGINPVENSSAGQRSARTPMSKKGRRGLRAVLWRAVVSLVRHNEVFARYVERLRNRHPKDHPLKKREALGAAMNKLLRIVYALLSKGECFDPQKALAG